MFNDETKKWYGIPQHIREKLEKNVFCVKCGETTITEYVVKPSGPDIVLEGKCIQCDGKVARVIDM
jgi:hypothetical protein